MDEFNEIMVFGAKEQIYVFTGNFAPVLKRYNIQLTCCERCVTQQWLRYYVGDVNANDGTSISYVIVDCTPTHVK